MGKNQTLLIYCPVDEGSRSLHRLRHAALQRASLSLRFPDRRWQSMFACLKTFISPGKLEDADGTMIRSALASSLYTLVSKRVGHARTRSRQVLSLLDQTQNVQRAVSRNLTMLGSHCPIKQPCSVCQRKPFDHAAGKATTRSRLSTFTHTAIY